MTARRITGVAIACAVATLLLVCVATASLAFGSRQIPLDVVWNALVNGGDSQDAQVVTQLRVPRTIAALMIGGALGLAGSVMQVMTRNPLADPGVLGINAGAAFVVVTVTALSGVATRTATLSASLAGAGLAAALVLVVSGSAGGSRSRLALAGIAVSAALASLTQAVLAANQFAFNEFRYWASGSLEGVDMDSVVAAGSIIACGGVVAALISAALGVLAIGEDAAVSLGVRVRLIRGLGVVAVMALAGGATALGGPMTFVGLAVPLMVRWVVGARQGAIASWSVIAGAVWVCAADVASRLILAPSEVPVGIVVALVGAPFFVIGSRARGMS